MIRRRWEVVRVPNSFIKTASQDFIVARRWTFLSAEELAGKLRLLAGPSPTYSYEVRERD